MKRATIADLARESNVSKSTIDRILSGRGSVKSTTVEHVLAVAERINFHATGAIRTQLNDGTEPRVLGFVLNARERGFYRDLAEHALRRVARQPRMRAVVRHVPSPDPDLMVSALMELAQECDAIACASVDDPVISEAISELASRGIPVFALITDLSAPERAGFVGANEWQLGRSAGWFMSLLAPEGGTIAVLDGSHRYTSQQSQNVSFRAFLNGAPAQYRILDSRSTQENDGMAQRIMTELLEEYGADLTGLFVTGGGIDGVIAALEAAGPRGPRLRVIANELTERSRSALRRGLIDVLLVHPVQDMIDASIDVMDEAIRAPDNARQIQRTLPFRIMISESC
ncbi:LacI family DNA-binding transcriptional regulator [Thioclava sp. GXIMD2076]|uniref:LacI family DNA-binding transcriptional regulator n=1 Tax=Thioclava kandeliae TaxID=3070818 RepID=A0ABV1SKU0_9RHOB